MSSTALKKKMEDVAAAWPSAPALDLSDIANDNEHYTIANFNHHAAAAVRDMALWRKQTLVLIGKFDVLLDEAAEHADDNHISALIETITPVVERIEATIQKIVLSLEPTSEVYIWLSVLEALGDRSMTVLGQKIERKYRKLSLQRLRMHQECKDHLMRVIWDHDPDARGGPKFKNADDLIAFLET